MISIRKDRKIDEFRFKYIFILNKNKFFRISKPFNLHEWQIMIEFRFFDIMTCLDMNERKEINIYKKLSGRGLVPIII